MGLVVLGVDVTLRGGLLKLLALLVGEDPVNLLALSLSQLLKIPAVDQAKFGQSNQGIERIGTGNTGVV